MVEKQRDLKTDKAGNKLVRPALFLSKHTVSEYSIFLEHLLVGLADESIPTALVCPTSCDVDSIASGAVEVIRHPFFELPLTGHLNRKILVERLEKFKPTVLHCLCESRAKLVRQLSRQLGLAYVLTVNSLQKRWRHFALQKRMRTLSISLKRCAKIIVPSKSIAANMVNVYPRFSERVEQINIGTFVEEDTRCFREPSGPASIVTALSLDNADKFENLFSAVRHLAIDGYDLVLVVIGSGRAERQLRKLLSALGLTQIVTIVPRLKPWRSALAAGDIFVQPVASTAFNPLLLEAMSIGVAVAGCRGGVDDLIIEDRTAVVFDPSDELSIMCSLQRLLDRRDSALQMAKGAQDYLRDNYSVSKMITAILQGYNEAQGWLKS